MARPLALLAVSLVLGSGCGTSLTQVTTFTCTATQQPLPSDCALVQAVAKDPGGNALGFLTVQVDSIVPSLGPAYLSGATATAGDGGFVLLVFRMSRFQQPHTPDTATVYVRGYDVPNPPAGTPPVSRAAVVMRFFPLGQTVTPTVGTAVFHPIPVP